MSEDRDGVAEELIREPFDDDRDDYDGPRIPGLTRAENEELDRELKRSAPRRAAGSRTIGQRAE